MWYNYYITRKGDDITMKIPKIIKEGVEIISGADGSTLLKEVMRNRGYKVNSNVPAGYSNGESIIEGIVVNHNIKSIMTICSVR